MGAVVVMAEFQALPVCKAVMFPEFAALNADLMLAAHCLGIVLTAVDAQAAAGAEFILLIAIAALPAEMIVILGILRAQIMAAVLLAAFAQVAPLAQLFQLKALSAAVAEVLLPLVFILRTDIVIAVIVVLAVFAETAVFALRIIRAFPAVGTEMLEIVGGFDAVAVAALSLLSRQHSSHIPHSAQISPPTASMHSPHCQQSQSFISQHCTQ